MLATLRIRNLALVDDLTLELPPGYVAITGETGAGKSIILGALNLVLGARADRTLIRSGCDSCSVEAVFDLSKTKLIGALGVLIERNGIEPCEEGQLLLKRTFSTSGANRQFVNGTPATLQALAELGDCLVDLHGPHDHQSLLEPGRQLDILDSFGGLEALRSRFADGVRKRQSLEAEKVGLVVDEATYSRQLDLLRHQVNEIESARLKHGEEEQLEPEYRRASNASRLLELGQVAMTQLVEDDASLVNQAGVMGRTLQEIKRLDPEAGCLLSLHEQAVSFWRDLQSDLSHYVDRVDVEPERLRELEVRIELVQQLKRKYGGSIEEVIAFGVQAQQQLAELEQRDATLARINTDLRRLDEVLTTVGSELSERRRTVIPKLVAAAARQLEDLGFRRGCFDVSISSRTGADLATVKLAFTGFDAVDFQFSPNIGEPLRPLRAIASSGEMARMMLALKTALAAQDSVPVLVFDELDANVGGETAGRIGEKMCEIGRDHQVLCITHLAPVAACASVHFQVTKQLRNGRTVSDVIRLSRPDRVAELTRMLGGQSEAARRHAEALLKSAEPR